MDAKNRWKQRDGNINGDINEEKMKSKEKWKGVSKEKQECRRKAIERCVHVSERYK